MAEGKREKAAEKSCAADEKKGSPQGGGAADQEHLKKIPDPLLNWYTGNRRILPWREDPAPYRVWISEIMLQQTRVEAGKAYFQRFVKELPDVEALANADDELLMKLWEGLGYYNRARNLKKAAGVMMERYGGRLPASYEELLELPGIGPYTAGAIGSIAFGIVRPAVDGNVLRVVSRILARKDDIAKASVKKKIENELQAVMPQDRPGDFNQALMELGAIVCLPNGAPKCEECPVAELCRARQVGIQEELPVKKAKKERRTEEKTVLILMDERGRMALSRRPSRGLLSGLWELPSFEGRLSEIEVRQRLEGKGIPCGEIRPAGQAKHIFSHVEWHMIGYQVRTETGSGSQSEGCCGGRDEGQNQGQNQGRGRDRDAGCSDDPVESWDAGRGGALHIAEEPAVYLRDVEERRRREAEAREDSAEFSAETLIFAGERELADVYAVPSAFRGFREFFPGGGR